MKKSVTLKKIKSTAIIVQENSVAVVNVTRSFVLKSLTSVMIQITLEIDAFSLHFAYSITMKVNGTASVLHVHIGTALRYTY